MFTLQVEGRCCGRRGGRNLPKSFVDRGKTINMTLLPYKALNITNDNKCTLGYN